MTRKTFFWIHLVAGLLAAVPLGIMALTGTLLAFEHRIVDSLERSSTRIDPDARRLPLDALAGSALQGRSPAPLSMRLHADPSQPAELRRGKELLARVDPTTGEVVSMPSSAREVFSFIERIHRWLGSREVGGIVTGVSALLCMLLSATGLVLWWPRSIGALRHVVWPRRGLSGKARDWQWHNAVGVLVLPFLFVLSATGSIIAWPWAEKALYLAVGSEPPRRDAPMAPGQSGSGKAASPSGGERHGAGGESAGTPAKPDGNWQAWMDTALAHAPSGWATVVLTAPSRGKGAQAVFRGPDPHTPSGGTVSLDASGSFDSWKPARTDAGPKLRMWARYLHTGELLGLPGQILMALAALGALLLVWTGSALSWRRFFARGS